MPVPVPVPAPAAFLITTLLFELLSETFIKFSVSYSLKLHVFPFSSDPVELQTIVSCLMNNVCEEEPISMFWAPDGLNELKEQRFEFPFILIGKSTMELLIGQSWRVVKPWYTGGGPEH